MEERKRDVYGDNFVDDYPSHWETARFMRRERINSSAVIYGVGLAIFITVVALVLGFIWAQAVESVVLNYSFLVDLTLAGSVLLGGYKGATRAKTLGLAHGALVGLGYSVVGILLLAVVATINWWGALESSLIAVLLGAIGGTVGINLQAGSRNQSWRGDYKQDYKQEYPENYDDFLTRP
jgi:putative membrane protein (TIGR04086 family)